MRKTLLFSQVHLYFFRAKYTMTMAVVNSTSDPITLPAITPVSWLDDVSDT